MLKAKLRINPEISDTLEEMKKFFAEVTGIVLFGQRLGAIQENLSSDSEVALLMDKVEKINDLILETDTYAGGKAYATIIQSQVSKPILICNTEISEDFETSDKSFESPYILLVGAKKPPGLALLYSRLRKLDLLYTLMAVKFKYIQWW